MLSPLRLIVIAAAICGAVAAPTPEPRKGSNRVAAAPAASVAPASGSASTSAIPSFWQPKSNFIRPEGVVPAKGNLKMSDAEEVGFKWIQNQFSLSKGDYKMSNCYTSNGITHLNVVQTFNGLPIANGVANVNIDSSGQVISGSGSIAPASAISSLKASERKLAGRAAELTAVEAVAAAAKAMNLKLDGNLTAKADGGSFLVSGASFTMAGKDIPASLQYYQVPPDGKLEKVWALEIQTNTEWQNVYVSASTGKIVGSGNWISKNLFDDIGIKMSPPTKRSVSAPAAPVRRSANLSRRQNNAGDFTYDVIPFGKVDFVDNGNRLSTVVNPADPVASPQGWHNLVNGRGPLSTTIGNNVAASSNFANAANPLRNPPVAASNFQFQFDFNLNSAAAPNSDEAQAGVTNMFVASNTFHDVMFHYGFDEAAGNFQVKNFKSVGKGGDPVVAAAQDGSGFNNANFASPPDGQAGLMRMFLFTSTNPNRDGAMENDIVFHELAHGLSNRLTGGADNANCLQASQAGGMGEGWSDFFGVAFQMKAGDNRNTDKAVGVFVTNNPTGVRKFAYSTSLQRNPQTYSTLKNVNPADVHSIGEVWMSMLYEVYWNVVDKRGFTPIEQLIASKNDNTGNVQMIKMIVQGLKIQPCNPTLLQARDAIFQADQVLFNGANKCDISRGFAKRGLGFSAVDDGRFNDAFDVDPSC
ncbi:hypothetical protein HDU96_001677 [Phlyctochytrium bullatum]|nr:hypothetical protein HDU96_001677 [Phlyctochytrium bullatum]